jgi:hypothetical protein
MNEEIKILNAILEEAKETNRLLNEMKNTLSSVIKKIIPEKKQEEVILKGGPVAEITVYSPDKLEEWMEIFESKGLRVEFSEPSSGKVNYFAKVWGYLEKSDKHKSD